MEIVNGWGGVSFVDAVLFSVAFMMFVGRYWNVRLVGGVFCCVGFFFGDKVV